MHLDADFHCSVDQGVREGCHVAGLGGQSLPQASEEEGVPPAQLGLTSILQVMIPGSLPTDLKALLRGMALVFLGLKYHRAWGGAMMPLPEGVRPALLLLLPNLVSHPAMSLWYIPVLFR